MPTTTPAATPAARQTRHALTALATASTDRRRRIAQYAETYLSQVDRRVLPVAYSRPIADDRANRADAYRMRGGDQFARMLGISCHPADPNLPDTARAVLAEIEAPVDRLVHTALATGAPGAVALLHCLGAA